MPIQTPYPNSVVEPPVNLQVKPPVKPQVEPTYPLPSLWWRLKQAYYLIFNPDRFYADWVAFRIFCERKS